MAYASSEYVGRARVYRLVTANGIWQLFEDESLLIKFGTDQNPIEIAEQVVEGVRAMGNLAFLVVDQGGCLSDSFSGYPSQKRKIITT